ncbi:UNVERIFIED_CONTAM: putative trehalose-phosphate phosphatase D [Sesamum calycinum]|uniref:Trehalose 6-phosphate phosphatase n=1 Tax=Sesamum calycinum TaxID=2727403 RepID=A0AAW2P919_9LAMI
MTNQTMVISDAKSGLTMAIAVALTESALYSPAMPLVSPNGYFASRKKLLKKLEANGNGARMNTLLDSMRASSPTRRPTDTEDHNSWILHHPSALSMFEEIMRASQGKQIVVFLDYDGTLSPIVEDPDRAFITTEMREAVRDVAKLFPTAIVSGRCRAKVYNFVRLSELYYAGSHGMDIKGPAKGHTHRKGNQTVLCQPAREFLPMIDEVYKALMEKVKCIPGAKVENNKFVCQYTIAALRKRYEDRPLSTFGLKDLDRKLLSDQVRMVINDYPQLRLTQGRKVLEIRPTIKWDKGNAVEFLLEALGYAESNDILPIYIGYEVPTTFGGVEEVVRIKALA